MTPLGGAVAEYVTTVIVVLGLIAGSDQMYDLKVCV